MINVNKILILCICFIVLNIWSCAITQPSLLDFFIEYYGSVPTPNQIENIDSLLCNYVKLYNNRLAGILPIVIDKTIIDSLSSRAKKTIKCCYDSTFIGPPEEMLGQKGYYKITNIRVFKKYGTYNNIQVTFLIEIDIRWIGINSDNNNTDIRKIERVNGKYYITDITVLDPAIRVR